MTLDENEIDLLEFSFKGNLAIIINKPGSFISKYGCPYCGTKVWQNSQIGPGTYTCGYYNSGTARGQCMNRFRIQF